MNLIDEIFDFFARLIRGRIDAVRFRARARLMNVQHQAKSAASKQFNRAIDSAAGKARQRVLPGQPPARDDGRTPPPRQP